jgi:uncharacterized UPF0160 family protein
VHAFNARFSHDKSGKIIVLESFFPWKDQLLEYEQEHSIADSEKPWFVVYPDSSGSWRVQTIPIDEYKSFSSRKALPEPWRGVRDENLSNLSGIPDCIFVHATGFIGGNKTFQGALVMAQKSLEF